MFDQFNLCQFQYSHTSQLLLTSFGTDQLSGCQYIGNINPPDGQLQGMLRKQLISEPSAVIATIAAIVGLSHWQSLHGSNVQYDAEP